jgi:hypothetical protein
MKIWKIAGILVAVVLALGILGVGMVFAQGVGSQFGNGSWGGMMGRGGMTPALASGASVRSAVTQGTAVPGAGYGMMGGGGMMRRGGMMGQGGGFDYDDMLAMRGWMMGPNGMHTQVLTDLAKALNLSLTDLQSQLQAGQTLDQIAQAQGVTQAQLETALETSLKDNLAKAVSAGTITQAQADQMLSYMSGNYTRMLDMIGIMGAYGGTCPMFSPTATPS